MTTLLDKATEFLATFPAPSDYGSGNNWGADTYDGKCAQLCFRFGDWMGWDAPTPPYNTATAVAFRSGPLNKDWTAAPIGAWHFWGKRDNDGHVGQDMVGGGTCVLMGYRKVVWKVGVDAGFDSVERTSHNLPTAWPYLGWATNYAGGRMDLGGFAGGSGTTTGDTMATLDAEDLYNIWTYPLGIAPGVVAPAEMWLRNGANETTAIARHAEVLAAIGSAPAGGAADLTPILDYLRTLPAATVAAFKAAL